MNRLRSHQSAAVAAGREIGKHLDQGSTTVLEVVPGGGKSRCIPLLYSKLQKKQRNGVVWLGPRLSLQGQNAQAAAEGVDGKGSLGLRIADSVDAYLCSPSEFPDGYSDNYCNLAVNVGKHISALKAMMFETGIPPLLVADEMHHLKRDDGSVLEPGWSRAFREFENTLHEFAERGEKQVHRLLMTGTPFRTDGAPVYGLEYGQACEGDLHQFADEDEPFLPKGTFASGILERRNKGPNRWIRYSREDAIAENAITRIRPYWYDGEVFAEDYGASYMMSEAPDRKLALNAARSFVHETNLDASMKPIVSQAYSNLTDYREDFPGAQLIVVCSRQSVVKKMAKWIRETMEPCAVAISDDAASKKNIDRFRKGEVNVLVTVAMAYEGMDAPKATHLVFLGSYRSASWLSQCFARVWRWGPSNWGSHDRVAHLYLPKDPRMILSCAEIEEDGEQPWYGVRLSGHLYQGSDWEEAMDLREDERAVRKLAAREARRQANGQFGKAKMCAPFTPQRVRGVSAMRGPDF